MSRMHNKIEAAQRIQAYILAYPGEPFSLAGLAASVGYSQRHCMRLFKEVTGYTIPEYRRLLRLTGAARQLTGGGTVLNAALDGGYDSHEGFTKAFTAAFGVNPSVYRGGTRPIRYFIPYPIYETFPLPKGDELMNQTICTATYIERPARRLIFLPSKTATDYMNYCTEMGCDWEGTLASIPVAMDIPALVTLPPHLVPAGFGSIAGGVEVPAGYECALPEGYRIAELPAGTLLYLQSPPYENPDDFCVAIEAACAAKAAYDPALYGYQWADDKAPSFNLGAETATGARLAFPVKKK